MKIIKNTFSLVYCLLIILNTSCSGLKSNKSNVLSTPNPPLSQIDLDEQVESVYKAAGVKLDKLTDEALKQGDEAKKFLSGDLFVKASDASLQGDSKTASFLLKYVVKLYPDDMYLNKKFAIELIKNGEFEIAEDILKKQFEKLNGKDDSIGLILAGVYSSTNKPKLARSTYRKVLKHYPRNEEACVFLSKSYAVEENYSKANEILSKCEKRLPRKGIFSYYKGKIALNRDKKKAAIKYFKSSLKKEVSFYQSAIALGIMKEEKEDYKGALKIYKSFIKKNPNNYTVLNRLVQVMFAAGKFKEVIPYAEKLSNLDPNDFNLKVRLGILYTDSERYSDAKIVFKEILAAYPESDKVLYYLGALFQQTADFEDAIVYYSKIKPESSLFHDTSIQLGYILQARAVEAREDNKNLERIDQFISFVKERSSFAEELKVDLKVTLAYYYEAYDEIDDAIYSLRDVVNTESFNDKRRYYLASLYEKKKDFKTSDEIVMKILEKNPEDAHALNFLGYSWLERDVKLEMAYSYIKKAHKLSPEDGYILDSLGWYYYKTGNINEAFKYIKKAWESTKNDAVIAKHLAIIYQEKEMFEVAKKFFVEALKLCKFQSERQDVLDAIENLERKRLPASVKNP